MSVEGLIVVLFTDLVGSTQLLGRLGEDEAERVRRIHFAEMRRAVGEHRGEEVKTIGDGLMAVFRSALDALECAAAIQAAVDAHERSADLGLAIRVGLHAGEPIRDEDDYFGTAVVVASRLCDAAQAGQILASAIVAGLVGSRSGRPLSSVGRLPLKGLAEPVDAYEVGWAGGRGASGGGPTDLPQSVLASRLVPPRPAPGALVRPELIDRVLEGLGGRLVMVVAAQGSGKTTLVAKTLERLDQPWVWLSVDERIAGAPQLVAHLAAALARRFPSFHGRPDPDAPVEDQLIRLCNDVQAAIPDDFVLAVDDATALGPAALAALAQLIEDLPPQVHLVLTARPPLPSALRRRRAGGTVVLDAEELGPEAAPADEPPAPAGLEPPAFRARQVHGRAAEVAALGRLLQGGVRPAVLALVGEAGIGKTRLAQWAVEHARERGRFVAQGTTHLGLPEPLGVFCDAVRGIRRDGSEPALDDPLAAGLPERLLPELGARAGDPATQGATFEAAVRYLQALAEERGLLLVLEDLHWADPTSLTLAALLARALAAGPVAMVVSYRPDEDAGAAALESFRQELRRMRAPELALGPLAPEEAAAMLAELLGRRPEPDVEAELVRLSGGNPFALEELAQAVVDSGWIDPQTGRRQSEAAVSVPWTLAESIRARSSRLASSERELLQWAAVIGEQFDIRLLGAAAGLGEEDVLAGLGACVAAGLVIEDPSDAGGHRFAFRHALVHEALAQERLVAQRARRHAAVLDAAEALAAQGLEVPAAELARHAVAAGDRRRIVLHCRAAADQAYEVGTIEEAVGHLERALEAWEEEDGRPVRAELLLECGRLRLRLSRGDERALPLLEGAREVALEIGDAPAAAVALSLLADARFEVGQRAQALRDWELSLDELRAVGPAEAVPQALAGLARAHALEEEMAASERIADEGLALLPAATDAARARVRVSLLTTRGLVNLAWRRLETGQGFLLDAARLAVEHQDDVGAARAHHILGSFLMDSAPGDATAHYARAAELVRRHGMGGMEAWYLALQAWSRMAAGDWTAFDRLSAEAEALISEGERAAWTRTVIVSLRADRLVGQGELEAALVAYEAAISRAREFELRDFLTDAQCGQAEAAFLQGEDRALEMARPRARALVEDEATVTDLSLDRWMVVVEALVASGESGLASHVAATIRRRRDSPWAEHADAIASVADQPPEAVAARVEGACAALEEAGFGPQPAQRRVAAGIVLAGRPGGAPAAASLARTAHARFAELGADAWCARLEKRLRELGEPLRKERAPDGGLTGREREVLELLAEGLTNRAIAGRLVISESTAIRHVANIYAKLGVHRRTEAVRVATDRGLVGAPARGTAAAPDT